MVDSPNQTRHFESESKLTDQKSPEKNMEQRGTLERELITKLCKESLTNEAVQGFIKIFMASHITVKIFWALSLLVANGLCAYLVIESILAYLSFGVSTSSRFITENPALFPKITICNNNQFTTVYAIEFIRGINQLVEPTVDIFNDSQMSQLSYVNKSYLINTIYTAAISKMLSKNVSDEERKKLGHSLKDILFACLFNNQPCGVDDFVWKFDRYYGNCYVFNSGFNGSGQTADKKMSLIAGYTYGLQLEFYVGFHANLSLFNSIAGKGGYVRIENSSYLNDDTLDGIFLTPGLSPSISIQRKFDFYLPKPYSNCDIAEESPGLYNSDLYDRIYYSPYTYTQQLCFTQCFQKRLIETCNCTDPQVLSLFSSITCETSLQQQCMALSYESVLLKDNFIHKECVPFCPLECNRTEYTTSISAIEIIGDLYADFIRANQNISADFGEQPINAETAKKSFSYAYLYYDSLAYTLSTEVPSMDIVALLANIGGTLGLFLGVSLLHLCEIVEVLIEIVFIKTEMRKNMQKRIDVLQNKIV